MSNNLNNKNNKVQLIIHRVKPNKSQYTTVKIPVVHLHAIPQVNDKINFDWMGKLNSKGKVTGRLFGVDKTNGDKAEFNRIEIFVEDV